MALCRACQRIFKGTPDVRQFSARGVIFPPFQHHSYREQLEKAAFENCYICRELWAVSSRDPPVDPGDIEQLNNTPRVDPGYVVTQHYSRYNLFLGDHIAAASLNFMVTFGPRRPEPKEPAARYHSYTFKTFHVTRIQAADMNNDLDRTVVEGLPDLGIWASSMKTAQIWLHRCLRDHERCMQSKSAQTAKTLPSRLLQIGWPSPEKIRLLENPGLEVGASQYATVSHCWGPPASHSMKLTSESSSRLKQGIDISDLGQTFQDLILAARYLGIGYVWIDSLCIIQDSKDDWLKASTLMSTIYRNGTINIAATAASDSRAGCFPPKDRSPAESCVVQTTWDNFENSIFGLWSEDIWDEFSPRDAKLPLLSRGWVLQEMLLAPRILQLTGKQLVWQCRTIDACEDAVFGVPDSPFQYPPAAKWRAFGRFEEPKPGAEFETSAQDQRRKFSMQEERRYLSFWSDILRDYTRKAFSFHTDKLVALSGVSRLMAPALGPTYFAGLWGRWMVSDLFWQVKRQFSDAKPQDLPCRPSPYRAPSWSWASLEEPITSNMPYSMSYDTEKRLPSLRVNIVDSDTESEGEAEQNYLANRSLVHIIDCRVESVISDVMGALNGGSLQVFGRLATLEILPDWKDNYYSIFCNCSKWSYRLDDTSNSGDNVEITLDCKPPSLRFHCLPIIYSNASPFCLLLSPTGMKTGQFRRSGTLKIYKNSLGLGKSVWEGFLKIKNEDWLEFESRDEDGWCTLSII